MSQPIAPNGVSDFLNWVETEVRECKFPRCSIDLEFENGSLWVEVSRHKESQATVEVDVARRFQEGRGIKKFHTYTQVLPAKRDSHPAKVRQIVEACIQKSIAAHELVNDDGNLRFPQPEPRKEIPQNLTTYNRTGKGVSQFGG